MPPIPSSENGDMPQAGKGLTDLPPELFNTICELCLVLQSPIEITNRYRLLKTPTCNAQSGREHFFQATVSQPYRNKIRKRTLHAASGVALLSVSPDIRSITIPIFYGNNTFIFPTGTSFNTFCSTHPNSLPSMRSITLQSLNFRSERLPRFPHALENLTHLEITLTSRHRQPFKKCFTVFQLWPLLKDFIVGRARIPDEQKEVFDKIDVQLGKGVKVLLHQSRKLVEGMLSLEEKEELRRGLLCRWGMSLRSFEVQEYEFLPKEVRDARVERSRQMGVVLG